MAEGGSPVIYRAAVGGNGGNGADFDNPWLAVANRFGNKPPIDVEARLGAMIYQGAGEAASTPRRSPSPPPCSIAASRSTRSSSIVLAATRAAAGHYGERWNWRREERAIRGMCETWLTKHPEIAGTQADDGKADTAAGRQTPSTTPPLALCGPAIFANTAAPMAAAGHYIRQQVVMTVAPGGYGKTSLIIINAIEMCLASA